MIPGFNDSVRLGDRLYHIQTEDLGTNKAVIVSQIFFQGRILHTQRTDYREKIGQPGQDREVKKLLFRQHRDMHRLVQQGTLEIQLEKEQLEEEQLEEELEDRQPESDTIQTKAMDFPEPVEPGANVPPLQPTATSDGLADIPVSALSPPELAGAAQPVEIPLSSEHPTARPASATLFTLIPDNPEEAPEPRDLADEGPVPQDERILADSRPRPEEEQFLEPQPSESPRVVHNLPDDGSQTIETVLPSLDRPQPELPTTQSTPLPQDEPTSRVRINELAPLSVDNLPTAPPLATQTATPPVASDMVAPRSADLTPSSLTPFFPQVVVPPLVGLPPAEGWLAECISDRRFDLVVALELERMLDATKHAHP